MKVKFDRSFGIKAVLAVLGLSVIFAPVVVVAVYFRDEQLINRWAVDNGYDVVSCERVSVGGNPNEVGQSWYIYKVVLKEKRTGQTRTAWFQVGAGFGFKQAWRREDLW
jgi:hypothetical protein